MWILGLWPKTCSVQYTGPWTMRFWSLPRGVQKNVCTKCGEIPSKCSRGIVCSRTGQTDKNTSAPATAVTGIRHRSYLSNYLRMNRLFFLKHLSPGLSLPHRLSHLEPFLPVVSDVAGSESSSAASREAESNCSLRESSDSPSTADPLAWNPFISSFPSPADAASGGASSAEASGWGLGFFFFLGWTWKYQCQIPLFTFSLFLIGFLISSLPWVCWHWQNIVCDAMNRGHFKRDVLRLVTTGDRNVWIKQVNIGDAGVRVPTFFLPVTFHSFRISIALPKAKHNKEMKIQNDMW